MSNLDLSYASSDGRLAAVALQGNFAGSAMNADLSPRANGRSVALRTSDLGSLLAFAGVYTGMEGGTGTLDLVGDTSGGYTGSIQTRDFTLVDEPRLSSLVGTSSGGASSLSDAPFSIRRPRASRTGMVACRWATVSCGVRSSGRASRA